MRSLLLSLLFGIAMLANVGAQEASKYPIVTLHFPDVALKKEDGERIESFEITLSCAYFYRIDKIPHDWSVQIISPVSAVSYCRGSSGHGAATLWSSRDLDGVVSVSVESDSCFDVTATIQTTTGHTVAFTKDQLVGGKKANQASQPTPLKRRG